MASAEDLTQRIPDLLVGHAPHQDGESCGHDEDDEPRGQIPAGLRRGLLLRRLVSLHLHIMPRLTVDGRSHRGQRSVTDFVAVLDSQCDLAARGANREQNRGASRKASIELEEMLPQEER